MKSPIEQLLLESRQSCFFDRYLKRAPRAKWYKQLWHWRSVLRWKKRSAFVCNMRKDQWITGETIRFEVDNKILSTGNYNGS